MNPVDPTAGVDPRAEFGHWRRVDPRTLGLIAAPVLVFAAIYVAVSASAASITVDSATELLLPLLALVAAIVRYLTGRYAVIDGAVRWRSGLLVQQSTQIGIDRIQDVEVTRPLLARIVGLAELKVSSAGGAGEIKLMYLDRALAERLGQHLQWLITGERAAHLAPGDGSLTGSPAGSLPPPPPEPARLVHRVTTSELTSWVLYRAWPLVLVVVAMAAVFVAAGVSPVWYALLPVVPMASVFGVKTVLDRVGLTVTMDPDTLFTSEGLTTVRRTSTQRDRVQLVMATRLFLQRRRGFESVQFASADVTANRSEGSVREELALNVPIGTWWALAAAVAQRPVADELSLRTKSPALVVACRRRWALMGAGLGALAAITSAGAGEWFAAVIVLAATPAVGAGLGEVRGRLRLGVEGWSASHDDLIVRRGVVRRRTLLLFAEKTQAVDVRSGPLQRRLGLVDVVVDVAPPKRSTRVVIHDVPIADGAEILDALVSAGQVPLAGGV